MRSSASEPQINEEFGGRVRAVATGDVGDLAMLAHDASWLSLGDPSG